MEGEGVATVDWESEAASLAREVYDRDAVISTQRAEIERLRAQLEARDMVRCAFRCPEPALLLALGLNPNEWGFYGHDR